MAKAATTPVFEPVAISLRELMPWLLFGGFLFLLMIDFVGG